MESPMSITERRLYLMVARLVKITVQKLFKSGAQLCQISPASQSELARSQHHAISVITDQSLSHELQFTVMAQSQYDPFSNESDTLFEPNQTGRLRNRRPPIEQT